MPELAKEPLQKNHTHTPMRNFWSGRCKQNMQRFWIILGFGTAFFLIKTFKDVIVQGRLFRFASYRLILKHEFNGPGEDVSGIMISTPQAFGKITLWDVKSKLLIYANLCRLVLKKKMFGFTGKKPRKHADPGKWTAGTPKWWIFEDDFPLSIGWFLASKSEFSGGV